jgi:hypothetical protein
LALYTGWRGWRALEGLRFRKMGWRVGEIDHGGFTLITLLAGFVIVGALDLTGEAWLAIALGVLIILGARFGVQRAKATLGAGPQAL